MGLTRENGCLQAENLSLRQMVDYCSEEYRENGCLQAENLSLRQMVDYCSEEYNSLEDSLR